MRKKAGSNPRSGGDGKEPDTAAVDLTSHEELDKAALRYLNRYDASVQQLRRVLQRHVARHAVEGQRSAAHQRIERLLERLVGSRLLDDRRYAESLTRGLRERGTSQAKIRRKLFERGVAEALVADALGAVDDATEDGELEAARAYARRKRLTSRFDLSDRAQREKALASLGRQGFSFDVARRALDL